MQCTQVMNAGSERRQTGSRCAHLAQLFRVLMQLLQDGESLLLSAVLQNPLNNSAAVRMCGKHKHLYNNGKGWKDEKILY